MDLAFLQGLGLDEGQCRAVLEAVRLPVEPGAVYAPGTGTAGGGCDAAVLQDMGYRQRLALKREQPEIYRTMKE